MEHKRKTIIGTDGTVMRLNGEAANIMVAAGNHKFTTKSKLHSYMKKDNRLSRNDKIIKALSEKDAKNAKSYRFPSGNVAALLPIYRGNKFVGEHFRIVQFKQH